MVSRRIALAAVVGGLSACGFELKRAPDLHFKTVQLVGFAPRSPLADELRANIDASTTTKVVDGAAQAQVLLEVLADTREKSVVASTPAGQVTEFTLRLRFRFRLRAQGGRELIPSTEIVQSRDMNYTETAALAKELEEASLYRSMQSDVVAQVMRRLASVQAV
jgi:LPS-assembly lipoprotein